MKDLCYIYEDINIFLVNKLEKRKKSLKKKSSSRTKKSSNNRNKKLKSKKIRFEDLEKSILNNKTLKNLYNKSKDSEDFKNKLSNVQGVNKSLFFTVLKKLENKNGKREQINTLVKILANQNYLRKKSSSFNGGSNDDNLCPICLETLDNNIITINCGHKFHFECLNGWKNEGKNTCPLCRGPIDNSMHYESQFIMGLLEVAQFVEPIQNNITFFLALIFIIYRFAFF